MVILSWSMGDGKVAAGELMIGLGEKPVLSFEFDSLYYEPAVGMRIKVLGDKQFLLTAEEIAECETEAQHLINTADYTVFAYDEGDIFRGAMLKSEAEKNNFSYVNDAPPHPASKWLDGKWVQAFAVIMENGMLRTHPAEICQLCMLVFTEEEWEQFSPKPTSPYESWDFRTETWSDRRTIEEARLPVEETIRRVFESARGVLLGGNIALLEQRTWDRQEQEARAYLKDSSSPTPYIDNILIGGGSQSKEEFCQSVIEKADAVWTVLAKVQSVQRLWLTELWNCTTHKQIHQLHLAISEKDWTDPNSWS